MTRSKDVSQSTMFQTLGSSFLSGLGIVNNLSVYHAYRCLPYWHAPVLTRSSHFFSRLDRTSICERLQESKYKHLKVTTHPSWLWRGLGLAISMYEVDNWYRLLGSVGYHQLLFEVESPLQAAVRLSTSSAALYPPPTSELSRFWSVTMLKWDHHVVVILNAFSAWNDPESLSCAFVYGATPVRALLNIWI